MSLLPGDFAIILVLHTVLMCRLRSKLELERLLQSLRERPLEGLLGNLHNSLFERLLESLIERATLKDLKLN